MVVLINATASIHRCALARSQSGVENGLEVVGDAVEGVAAATGYVATAVPAMVERDHAVVAGKIGDLMHPDPYRAGDAVGQHDRIAVVRAEHLRVQADTVAGAHGYRPAGWHVVQGRVRRRGFARRRLASRHERSHRCGRDAARTA